MVPKPERDNTKNTNQKLVSHELSWKNTSVIANSITQCINRIIHNNQIGVIKSMSHR
jgi:hypothetical protein